MSILGLIVIGSIVIIVKNPNSEKLNIAWMDQPVDFNSISASHREQAHTALQSRKIQAASPPMTKKIGKK